MKNAFYCLVIAAVVLMSSTIAFSGCDDVSDYNARKACEGDCSYITDYNTRKLCEGDTSYVTDYNLRKAAEGDCSYITDYNRRKACESCSDKKWWVTMYMLHEVFECR